MAEIDPYATLGVSRTATRQQIARAYRALAKRHHPDAGAAPSAAMARINEAWHILSDVNRRARWDRLHAPVLPPPWAAAPGSTYAGPAVAVPRPAPPTPTTVRDSPWFAVGAVAAATILVGAALLAFALIGRFEAGSPPGETVELGSLRFDVPAQWTLSPGRAADGDPHRLLAHLVTFPVLDGELCTEFDDPCPLSGGRIPPGQASVLITEWTAGEPPVARPGLGLDREDQTIIGGAPAALQVRRTEDGIIAWWQLTPPDFPDRWIEIRAAIGGLGLDRRMVEAELQSLLDSIEFVGGEG